jgi:hypothetical protein
MRLTTLAAIVAVVAACSAATHGVASTAGPSIRRVSLPSGTYRGGSVVTVMGTSFAHATRVTFGGVPGRNLIVHSSTYLSVTTPAHDPGVVGVAVTTPTGTSRPVRADHYQFLGPRSPLKWAFARTVDESATGPRSLSCVTQHFCVALDGRSKYQVFDGTGWTGPESAPASLLGVSCLSTTSCLGFGHEGIASFDGRSWSDLRPEANRVDSADVSCGSATLCAVAETDEGDSYSVSGKVQLWNGASWTAYHPTRSFIPSAVSCVGTKFCAALDYGGDVSTWDGAAWSAPVHTFIAPPAQALSCTSPKFCLAGGAGGQTARFDGARWTSAGVALPGAKLRYLSCASATFCVAGDDSRHVITYTRSWGRAATVTLPFTKLACTSAAFCLITDPTGRDQEFAGSGWAPARQFAPAGGLLGTVSCPSTTFCAAADAHGNALTYNGSGWSMALGVVPSGARTRVDCSSTTFCVLVGKGSAATYDGSTWSAAEAVDTAHDFTAVSCPADGRCFAFDSRGYVAELSSGRWSSPHLVDAQRHVAALSCPTETYCLATDSSGYFVSFSRGRWGKPVRVYDTSHALTALSCATSAMCMGIGGKGRAVTRVAGRWQPAVVVHDQGLSDVVCTSIRFCAVTTVNGWAYVWTGRVWSAPAEHYVDARDGVYPVSCASSSWCMVVGDEEAAIGRA